MISMFDLTGKVAVVTGASSGIGVDAAVAYAEAGADVALMARRIEKLNETKARAEKFGHRVICVECDVLKEDQVRNAVETAIREFGQIDILLNNAGVAQSGVIIDTMSEEEWDIVIDTNLKGVFFVSKYVAPHMKKRGYGKIVNIASVDAMLGCKYDILSRHNYCASKGGVISLTKAMAASYAQHGISVNAIAPGLFISEMTEGNLFKNEAFMASYEARCPTGRPSKPGELNGTVIYLSSDATSYVQGQVICVDGGVTIV